MKSLLSDKQLLLITVFLTGAVVLVIEITGVRLLAPYYGSSLPVLSSVLTVVLGALSLGYYIGGRLADKFPYPTALFSVMAGAGFLLLILGLIAVKLLPTLSSSLGLGIGPLILSLLFFFTPAFLLGIDSPFVIKLLTANTPHDKHGALVGTVFFWSTIGSITGSIGTGFLLIPYVGLVRGLAVVSLALTIWCLLLWWHFGFKTNKRLLFMTIGMIVAIFLANALTNKNISSVGNAGTVIYERDGLYSHMEVFEKSFDGTLYRFLKNDTNHSSAIIPGNFTVVFPYAQYALLYKEMVPKAKNYLVLGGGAYTIPRHIHHLDPSLIIHTIENEPFLEEIAHTYFELPVHPNIHNYNMDARVFLQSTTTKYDVIFSDVMNSGHFIPPHLLTIEFFSAIRDKLSPDGVAMFNYIGSTDTHGISLTGSLIKTITAIFPNLAVIPVTSTTDPTIQNILLVVRHPNKLISFPNTLITHQIAKYSYPANSHFITIPEKTLDDEITFTDDRAPIEPLLAKQFRLHNE